MLMAVNFPFTTGTRFLDSAIRLCMRLEATRAPKLKSRQKIVLLGYLRAAAHDFPSFITQDLDGQQLCGCAGRQKRCANRYAYGYGGDPQAIEQAGMERYIRNGIDLRVEWNQMVCAGNPGKRISDT